MLSAATKNVAANEIAPNTIIFRIASSLTFFAHGPVVHSRFCAAPHEGASFQAPSRQHRPLNHGSGVAPGAIAGDVSPRRAQATTAAKAWERTVGPATPDSDWKPGGYTH